MKISTKGRYSLRLMIDLAEHNDGSYISLKDVSKRQNVSLKYLEQIIIPLSKANLIDSIRGAKGGHRLSKHPSKYTAGDIIRATEGSLNPITCLDSQTICENYDKCATIDFWEGLAKVINNYVDSITLEDLANNHISKVSNIFSI